MNATEKRITAAAIRLFAERGSLDLTISELAQEAQVARGTMYRNVESIERLFATVIENLAVEFHSRVSVALDDLATTDPAVKLATALRMFIRLGHENPAMGKFMVRFGLTDESLRGILSGQPARDIAAGIAAGRYTIPASMQLSVASFMAGATVSAMWMVLEGHQGWREAGASTAELLLRSLGVAPEEATRIAALDLPAMPES